MKVRFAFWCVVAIALAGCPLAHPQDKEPGQKNSAPSGIISGASTIQEKNVQEYVELLRSDVRHQKAEIMGTVMQLDINQSSRFWPIYSEYDRELTRLNDLRLANIQEYARNYSQMTDAKADELIKQALAYHNRRSELLAKYYERVKTSLGAIEAARFVQVENQLLLVIDLQINSNLPIVPEGF